MKEWQKIFLQSIITGIIFVLLTVCLNVANAQSLEIKMLNAGQGDAILVKTDNKTFLFDTSDADEREKLRNELYKANIFKFDKVILTHPHADHIGNMSWLIQNGIFSVKGVVDNGIPSPSRYYQNYISQVNALNVPHEVWKSGDVIELDEDIYFYVFNPNARTVENVLNWRQKDDPNNNSIVGKLVFKNFSVLFTGDAETPVETRLIETKSDIKATVLKSGHHGAKSANSAAFVRAVAPECVIISAGEPTDKRGGNTYGHPRKEALQNFLNAGVGKNNIFWTWKNGTITIKSDGENFTVTPENAVDWLDERLDG